VRSYKGERAAILSLYAAKLAGVSYLPRDQQNAARKRLIAERDNALALVSERQKAERTRRRNEAIRAKVRPFPRRPEPTRGKARRRKLAKPKHQP